MRKNFFAVLCAAVMLVGCGGAAKQTGTTTPPGGGTTTPPTPTVTPVTHATYRQTGAITTKAFSTSAAQATPTGLPEMLIVEWDGGFVLNLADGSVMRGAMSTDQNGNLKVSSDAYTVGPTGVYNAAPTFTGTTDGTTAVGTVNGASFSVTVTNLQATPVVLSDHAGIYVSTDNTTGYVLVNTLDPAHNSFNGYAYATLSDYTNGKPALYNVTASVGYTDNTATTHINALNFGAMIQTLLTWQNVTGTTIGYCYFDASGNLIAVSISKPGGTLSAGTINGTWVKQ